ncbi:MAG: ABC transporter permease [Nocardioidaceae bacterium]
MASSLLRRRSSTEGLGLGLKLWVAAVTLLLIAPTLIVIPMSFSASHTFQFPPEHWSVKWYQNFFTSEEWLSALGVSIKLGLIVAALATVLGIAAAIGLDRWTFKGIGVIRGLIMAPMIVPGVVVAIAVYSLFLKWQLAGTLTGFVLAHTALALPFVVVSVSASLAGYDRRVEAASSSLGAGPLVTFRRVTLPLILPGVGSGFIFAFITSFDEVVVALFLQTPDIVTLPVRMYTGIATDIDPTVAAASTIIVTVTTIVLVTPQLLRLRRRAT